MAEDDKVGHRSTRRVRTRHGCLNCKTKRRKCDEIKPTCRRCSDRGDTCEWGSRLIFREANALGVNHQQRPLAQNKRKAPTRFEIKDVTAEVIRDYQHYEPTDDKYQQSRSPPERPPSSSTVDVTVIQPQDPPAWHEEPAFQGTMSNFRDVQGREMEDGPSQLNESRLSFDLPDLGNVDTMWHSPSASWNFDDSVFIPGSAYLDAHFTLRNHLMHEIKSTENTCHATPDASGHDLPLYSGPGLETSTSHSINNPEPSYDSRPGGLNLSQTIVPHLTEEGEFMLWKNWVDEIAPWVDKFDGERHFQHTLPVIARSHDHLRYAILAVSARQLERKQRSRQTERSLSLYQMAIQLILPELHTRSTAVIASCVVLCVLEMSISSAKAWRQHLDGCAHLIEAVGINGFSGGVHQALFWCFARMDVCSGLIASEKTLISVEHWATGIDLDTDVNLFRSNDDFNSHACYSVYLCAQVLDLLAFLPHLAERVGAPLPVVPGPDDEYTSRWKKLWSHIESWYAERPAEMLPVFSTTIPSEPFPKLLFSNPAAISGNQQYHTAAILMLQYKPSNMTATPKPRSIFWHARQICAISMSNDHHGAWANSIQPLWIAGQWMSHESEQKAILSLLARIEREMGWGTKWRAEDLKEFWGFGGK
ncbi:hypothetical protein CC86DRAFT_461440 [Ophiobolus disseminans]|uniref:Zn(2)-C6 fungal-type domain-containing protein n=1 Tax=Ophiobolus disseminans TaxID=1469910 RepID=A0A6A7AK57_9PLEO|nr:hypothetical protein CC86DRAFT_461440 [Ophiobolus disseminans]